MNFSSAPEYYDDVIFVMRPKLWCTTTKGQANFGENPIQPLKQNDIIPIENFTKLSVYVIVFKVFAFYVKNLTISNV